MGVDAIFKNRQVVESTNMKEAIKFISKNLPKQMQVQMAGRYVANGNEFGNSQEYINDVIVDSVVMASNQKEQDTLSFDAAINKAAGTTAGKQSEQKRNLKSLEILIQGSLNKTDYNIVSSNNPSINMTLHGNSIGALANFDNNVVPKAPISTAIESSIGPLIDKNHVTMGTQKINESMFDTIMYDGNDVLNVWAPVDANGDIDLSGMQLFNEILAHFDKDSSLTTADKNNILAQYGIQGHIDDSGKFVGSGNMSQFLVFTGITSDEVINEDDDLAYVLDKDQKKYELDQIERVYGYLNGKTKNKKGKLDFKKGWFDFTTDIIKAPVFMKLKPTAQTQVGAFSNHGPVTVTPTYQNYLAQDQMRYNRQQQDNNIVQPSTNLLFSE